MDIQALETLLRSMGVDYTAVITPDRRSQAKDDESLKAAELLIDLAMGLHPDLKTFDATVSAVRTSGPRRTP